jgi:hypothetical protein
VEPLEAPAKKGRKVLYIHCLFYYISYLPLVGIILLNISLIRDSIISLLNLVSIVPISPIRGTFAETESAYLEDLSVVTP